MEPARTALLSALALTPALLFAQLQSDADALDQMRYDVKYLSSDLLEGREAGTPGEKLAADYVAAKFGNVGLMPYGDSASYLQAFTFQAEPFLGPSNALQMGRSQLKLEEAYGVLPFSAPGLVRGKLLKAGFGIDAPNLGREEIGRASCRERV